MKLHHFIQLKMQTCFTDSVFHKYIGGHWLPPSISPLRAHAFEIVPTFPNGSCRCTCRHSVPFTQWHTTTVRAVPNIPPPPHIVCFTNYARKRDTIAAGRFGRTSLRTIGGHPILSQLTPTAASKEQSQHGRYGRASTLADEHCPSRGICCQKFSRTRAVADGWSCCH